MNKLIVITGPTASGKTGTSINIAKYIRDKLQKDVAIINFDSLLFYKEISIGTAKPTPEECESIPHYLMNIESINHPLNAADYIELAKSKIDELHQQNIIPILVGGSAFYLRALLKGMYESPKTNENIRNEIDQLYNEGGISPIIAFLKINDPEALTYLHENDHYRLIRAMEFFKTSGTKISEQKKSLDMLDPYDFNQIVHPWNILHLYLDLPKDVHQEIIKHRTLKMFEHGLIEEVETLLKNGYSTDLKPLQSIGYKEVIMLIQGQYPSKEDCIERIIISTRQLAKSQRTFFNKIHPKIALNSLLDQSRILEITRDFI
jgi:tRNA dimethylallyltransferase